jgi:hypothetical protein
MGNLIGWGPQNDKNKLEKKGYKQLNKFKDSLQSL